MSREEKLEKVLKAIIDDFDQEGCSDDLGVIRTSLINRARRLLGQDQIDDDSPNKPEVFEQFPNAWEKLLVYVEALFEQGLEENSCTAEEFIVDYLEPEIAGGDDGSTQLWFEVDYQTYRWDAAKQLWVCTDDEDDEDG